MSEEEKKAIEQLNKRYEFFKENPLATNVWLTLDIHNLGIILNLIEKQQKEIKELKKKNQDVSDRIEYYLVGNMRLDDFDFRNGELRRLEKMLEE